MHMEPLPKDPCPTHYNLYGYHSPLYSTLGTCVCTFCIYIVPITVMSIWWVAVMYNGAKHSFPTRHFEYLCLFLKCTL